MCFRFNANICCCIQLYKFLRSLYCHDWNLLQVIMMTFPYLPFLLLLQPPRFVLISFCCEIVLVESFFFRERKEGEKTHEIKFSSLCCESFEGFIFLFGFFGKIAWGFFRVTSAGIGFWVHKKFLSYR